LYTTLIISGTAYDFANADSGIPQADADFNNYLCGVQKGMVEDQLGPDNKPVLKDGKGCVESTDSFNMWFRSTPGVNIVFPVQLVAYWNDDDKSYKYRSDAFFPLDGLGYGNDYNGHNFGFCFEFHSSFTYEDGQRFDFTGDDDVWVFINSQLAIDLGGVHGAASESVTLSSLGLTVGETYPLDFFFCERHTSESHLWFSTSIVLNPCGTDDFDADGYPDLCDPCPKGDQVVKVWADDYISSDNTVTFHMVLTMPQVDTYSIRVNFGDGPNAEDNDDMSNWTYYDVSSEMTITHSYKKTGEYKVYFEGENSVGCGKSDNSLTVKCGGKRLAPKCSEMPLVPGSNTPQKRFLAR